LKGGANRFGIVTRYEVQAIHTGHASDKQFFGGLILVRGRRNNVQHDAHNSDFVAQYPNSSSEALINATQKYVSTVNDPKACT